MVPLSLLEQLDTPDGAFRIEREIEGGGMSRVFIAIDRELGRRIVVKVLPPELLTDLSLERFRREIRIAANLQHPTIVPVLGAGQTAALTYYTMPHVAGETLRQRLARAAASGSPLLPLDEVVRILREVVRALAYAHRHGVVHRDIKPENILLADDAVVVTDFGVAKALSSARIGGTAVAITETGGFVGTPAYMAPEQAAGDPAVDHRADIYSFGVLAYEMLTGAPPFRGGTAGEMMLAHASATPAPIDAVRGDVPLPLSRAVMCCLAKAPAERPPRATELRDLLDSVGPRGGTWRAGRMRRRLPAVLVAVVVAAVLIAGARAITAAHPAESRWMAMLAMRPPSTLRTNRYVVKPFTNMTGDSTLNLLGDEVADFIGDALQLRVAGIEVVDWRATQASMAVVDHIPWYMRPFRSKERALAYESGAGMLITGRIYRDADLLRLHTEMTDVVTRRKLQTIQDVAGSASAHRRRGRPALRRLGDEPAGRVLRPAVARGVRRNARGDARLLPRRWIHVRALPRGGAHGPDVGDADAPRRVHRRLERTARRPRARPPARARAQGAHDDGGAGLLRIRAGDGCGRPLRDAPRRVRVHGGRAGFIGRSAARLEHGARVARHGHGGRGARASGSRSRAERGRCVLLAEPHRIGEAAG
jgi:tRNA A-37 threonylcarbamoyl transferase component Bud32/TolB-like protein